MLKKIKQKIKANQKSQRMIQNQKKKVNKPKEKSNYGTLDNVKVDDTKNKKDKEDDSDSESEKEKPKDKEKSNYGTLDNVKVDDTKNKKDKEDDSGSESEKEYKGKYSSTSNYGTL